MRIERERARLERENTRLKDELEAARRAGARQAAPFSKGAPTRPPRRPGRKPGRPYGRRGQRPIPTVVHERHDVPVPTTCPGCGGAVRETHVAAQYQEDLPPITPIVRRFDVHVGQCHACHRRVQGRHPLQTSDALGAAAVPLGPHAIALAVSLNKQFGVSFGKIATVFRTRFGLHVTPSVLVRARHRAAARGQPTYAALCESVRASPVVVPDETGWKVRGLLHWLWVFATATTTVYRIRRGRGCREAASVLGADFAGGLGRDGWAPYRQFTEAFHQSCVGHLLRRCRTLQQDHPRARFPRRVAHILQHAPARAQGARPPPRGHDLGARRRCRPRPPLPPDAGPARRSGPDSRQPALRAASDGRTAGPLQFSRGPRSRRHELASRAGDPAGRDHAQGVWRRESHAPRRGHATGAREYPTHRASASLDATDVLTTLMRAPAPIVSPHFYPTVSVN